MCLRQQLLNNLGSLVDICGDIAALLEIVDESPDNIWPMINGMATAYDMTCDEGIMLLNEYENSKTQWREEFQRLVVLLLHSATGAQSHGPVAGALGRF